MRLARMLLEDGDGLTAVPRFSDEDADMPDTNSLLMYVTYRLQPHDVDAFEALARRMAAAATARDGCVFLHVARDIDEPATFRLIEGWRDQAAFDAHVGSDAFQSILAEAGGLGIVDRVAEAFHVATPGATGTPA